MQMIAEILPGRWALGLILGVVFGVWTTTAGASDLQSALAGLGAKRRSDIKQAVVVLGTLNDPAALSALEALRELDSGHGIDTSDGRTYSEMVIDGVVDVTRRLNNFVSRGILS